MRREAALAGSGSAARVAEAAAWNTLVQTFPRASFRQGFEWGALRAELGWQPTRIAVVDPHRGTAACSVLCRQAGPLGAVLYAPQGPLFHVAEPGALAQLLEAVRALARQTGAILFRAQLAPGGEPEAASLLARHGFVAADDRWLARANNTHLLDLRRPQAELWRGVSRRPRSYITAAARAGLVIEDEGEAALETLYPLLVNAGRLKRFGVRDRDYYRSLWRCYRGGLMLLVARLGGRPVGGLIGLRFGTTAFLLYVAVRTEGAEAGGVHVSPPIHWEFVVRAKAAGCHWADLGSSVVDAPPDPANEGYGVYRFKTGLGGAFASGPAVADLVFRPRAYRALRLGERHLLPRLIRLAAHPAGRRLWLGARRVSALAGRALG